MDVVHLGALFVGGVEGVADLASFGARHAFFHKLVIGFGFHKQARARAAALALVEEQRKVGAFDGLVQISVGKDNIGTLATQFQGDALQVALRRRFHDQMADLR